MKKKEKFKEGIKFDSGKERFDLIPARPLFYLAKVYTFGAKKYEDRNWEKGMKWGKIFGAIQRHLWKFWMGEDLDDETGLPHLAHAAWGCLTLLEYYHTHSQLDDRTFNKSNFERFLKELHKLKNELEK